jgi:hypothetical protein
LDRRFLTNRGFHHRIRILSIEPMTGTMLKEVSLLL